MADFDSAATWAAPATTENSMDKALRNEMPSGPLKSRRQFLQQLATRGAAVTAAASLPATAQENAERPRAAIGSPGGGSVAETLADFAIKLRYEDLPADVVRLAKRSILDTIGCAIGGSEAGPSRIAIKLAAGVSATPGATVLCSGIRTSHELAVFANGVMIRYLDFNDGYITPKGGGHPSDVLAALIPSAEIAGRDGRDLILATVLAYEVFCKVADVLDTRGLGLDQSTMLGLASLVGASRLMGLTSQQMVHAIGIVVGGNTAINQGRVGTLSNWKDFASAEASRKAVFAAQLAQAGMTGPSQIFEGPLGFFNVISRKTFDLPKLGEPFGIRSAFTKRFPLGQYSQTVAEAAAQLRSFFADTDDIDQVNIRVSRNAIKVMADSPDKWRPQSHETADHSMPYAAAVVLMHGTIDDHYYEDPYLHDPRLLDLVSRVRCIPSAEADMHEKDYNLCDFEIVLKSGKRNSVRVEYHRGHPKNPMTDAEMEEKFRSLTRKHLPAERIDALLQQLQALEEVPKIGTLVEMTRV
jgi:2-methylcitrate dehydratase